MLLLSLVPHPSTKASMIMKEVQAHMNQQESTRKHQVAGIAGKNIRLAEHMFAKFKKC